MQIYKVSMKLTREGRKICLGKIFSKINCGDKKDFAYGSEIHHKIKGKSSIFFANALALQA